MFSPVVPPSVRVPSSATTLATRVNETMATHGMMKLFNSQVDDWPTYVERLQYYFVTNDMTDAAKKRAILLTVCGAPTYKLLRSLVPDGKLDGDSATYDSLVKLLTDYYNPKPSLIVQRFNFNSRSRKPNEPIATYVAALRELALQYDYGDQLQQMLRDRLVCGVNHRGIQRKLLAEADLTYDRAYSLALAAEAAERDAEALQTSPSVNPAVTHAPLPVYHVSPPVPPSQSAPTPAPSPDGHKDSKAAAATPISCYHCGGSHPAPQCTYKNTVCRYCKKTGHLARVCRKRLKKETEQGVS